jgi:ActR/RegA family two-component response regulator
MKATKYVVASTRKVLVVDDSSEFCEACVRVLTRAGFVAQSALKEADAIQKISHEDYDVAFVDIMLSDRGADRGGFNVISEILKVKPDTKIVVISGAADITVAVEALRLGVFDFLRKGDVGISEELVATAIRAVETDDLQTSKTSAPMREKFKHLAAAWRSETQFSSSVSEMFLNKNYQAIIGQGVAIVPFILEDLKKGPDHWYWALGAITGVNPAESAAPGDIAAISAAWLEWGKRRGIIR